jgi:hypothetical protein
MALEIEVFVAAISGVRGQADRQDEIDHIHFSTFRLCLAFAHDRAGGCHIRIPIARCPRFPKVPLGNLGKGYALAVIASTTMAGGKLFRRVHKMARGSTLV